MNFLLITNTYIQRYTANAKCSLIIACLCALGAFVVNSGFAATPQLSPGQTAIAMHGDIKYGPSFEHFDYVNPHAPKGGTIRLAVVSSSAFDSLNPYIYKGVAAAGMDQYVYQRLMVPSHDEAFTLYANIAERVETPNDRSWVIFHLNPLARFHDGEPIQSDDVATSFELLTTKGSPYYAAIYDNVERVEILSEHSIKFHFKAGENRELPLIIASQLPILAKHYWEKPEKDFSKTSLEPPVGSGPYIIDTIEKGRGITYKRVKDWWAKDLPVHQGRYNFDTIRVDYYRDSNIAVEAFKAGEFDFRQENSSKNWATSYTGERFDNGEIIRVEVPHSNPTGMQAFLLNTRRKPFDDIRVREALAYTFDYEWTNRQLFYNAYTRTQSWFSNSELAASGPPTPEELAILEPYRDQVPKQTFTDVFRTPRTDGPGGFRANLRKALHLLQDAGWEVKDRQLLNKETGEQMKIEFLLRSQAFIRIVQPVIKNMQRLGIDASLRHIDMQQYVSRLQNFDFDTTVLVVSSSLSPGNELRNFWKSEAADRVGSQNYIGIKNPVVDELVEKIIAAPDRESLIHLCRALDRVMLWNHYAIPNWHIDRYRLVYWNKFGHPDVQPDYDVGLDNWWIK